MVREEKDLLGDRLDSIEAGLKHFMSDGPARAMSLLNSIK
jgi:hypothetical protein